MRKTFIFGNFGRKWPILEVFGQNGQNGNFFKKALGTLFSRLQALTNCKVSKKSNERFSSNSVTDGRTDGHKSLGLQRLHRETKKSTWDIFPSVLRPKFI